METLILLVASLFMTPTANSTTTYDSSYSSSSQTTTYDPATGDQTVSNPDGSIIVIDPSEND